VSSDRKRLEVSECKLEKWYEQGGICPACGEFLAVQEAELAHRIPQRKYYLKQYGPRVIHHPLNLVLTHRGACNDAVSISNHPVEVDRLAARIRKELKKGGDE